jgi:hypothetical protein
MKITNMHFTKADAAALYALAGAALMDQGKSRKEARTIIAGLTPQNLVRLALGLPIRRRGGARPNTGRRKQPDQTPSSTQ